MKHNILKNMTALFCFFSMSIGSGHSTSNETVELASKCKDILNQTKSYFIGYKHHLEDHLDFLNEVCETHTIDTSLATQSLQKNVENANSYIDYVNIQLVHFDLFTHLFETPQTSKNKLSEGIECAITHFLLTRLNNLCARMTTKTFAQEKKASGNRIIYLESTAPCDTDFNTSLDLVIQRDNSTNAVDNFALFFNIFSKKNVLDLYFAMSNTSIELARLLDLSNIRTSQLKRVIRCSPSLWAAFTGESENIYHPDYVNDTFNEWESYCELTEGEFLDEDKYPIPAFMKPRKVLQEARPVVGDWLEDTKPSSQKKSVKKPGKGSQKKPKQHQQKQQTVVEIADTKQSANEVVEIITEVIPVEDIKVASEVAIAVVAPTVAPTQPAVSAPLKKAVLQKAPSPERAVAAPAPINVTHINPLEEKVSSLKANLQATYHDIMHNIQFSYMNLCSLWTALGGTVLPAPGGGSHCKLLYGNTFIGGTFRPHGADGFGPRCRGDIKDIFNGLGQHLASLGA